MIAEWTARLRGEYSTTRFIKGSVAKSTLSRVQNQSTYAGKPLVLLKKKLFLD